MGDLALFVYLERNNYEYNTIGGHRHEVKTFKKGRHSILLLEAYSACGCKNGGI